MSTNSNGSYLTDEELEALDAEIEAAEAAPQAGDEKGLTDVVIRKAAALHASGAGKNKVRQELKLSAYMVRKVWQHELFRSTVAEISNDAVAAAKAKIRHEIARMQPKAMAALEKNLDKHSLEAVKVFLRAMGMEQEAENKDQGGFTLVLANQAKPDPKTVIVKQEGEE